MNSAIRLQAVILVILSVHLCFLNGLLHDSSLGGELPNEAFNPLGGGVPDEGFNPVMTVPDLIRYWGYPAEEHWATTPDGYILSMHRIPHGKDGKKGDGVERVPVFLGHCLVGSSAIWSFGPPEFSIAYLLADRGYDVWMPNIRGNSYSRNHTTLDPCTSCSEFWSFGLEEPALLDYPTFIDYIVNKSGHADMHFVGYSMGTTQYLILLSEQPEYNARFRSGFLLGPTAFAGNHTNPFGALAPYGDSVKYIFDLLGVHEFMPNFLEIKSWLAHTTCHISNLHSKACRNLYALFVGMDPSNLNMTMVPTYMSHMPCGSSTTQFKHYAQLADNGGRFTKLDLGAVMNLVKYGQSEPPEYEVAKVTAKTLLFSGEADTVSTPADADKLASVMGDAVVHNEVVDYSGWSHLGFIWNTDARTVLYDRMIDMMQKMDREEKKKSS